MLNPFFCRVRRYVFSYSGFKFCPVSFSAVWPPLYKRTCGHFSSYNGKLLVHTIFVLANHTAATQCIWSCGRGEDASLKLKASSGGRTRTWSDFEGGERGRVVSDGSLVCQRFTNCRCAAGILTASQPSRGFPEKTEATSSERQLAGGRRCADVRGQNGRLVGGRRKAAVTQTSRGDSQGLQKSVCVQ